MQANTALLLPVLAAYLAFVLTITVFQRVPTRYYQYKLTPFWSYRAIFKGSFRILEEIFWNIALFIPIGAVLSMLFKERLGMILAAGLLLSAGIEILQLVSRRGLFEFDDIFHNTLGVMVGYLAYRVTEEQVRKHFKIIVAAACGCFCLAIVIAFLLYRKPVRGVTVDDTAKNTCFQVDEVKKEADSLVMTGFAFSYEEGAYGNRFAIALRSTRTGDMLDMSVEYGLEREDVNRYFACDVDYSRTGFRASVPLTAVSAGEEYEIQVKNGDSVIVHDDVYITDQNIHYVPEAEYVQPVSEGTDLEKIVKDGILRVFRPDQACYVYQYEGCLYWIADDGFAFEDDGSTYIQYQLYTTQIENLPFQRLVNEWYWDNIGALFEDYEITDEIDCGRYRVCKRILPDAYAINAVVTGYYQNNEWIWIDYFRPYYEL